MCVCVCVCVDQAVNSVTDFALDIFNLVSFTQSNVLLILICLQLNYSYILFLDVYVHYS